MPPHHISSPTNKTLEKVAQILDLALLTIRHDKLADFAARAYSASVIQKSVNRLCGRRHRALDPAFASLAGRILVRSASLPYAWVFKAAHLSAFGHSVTAVYQKR